MDDIQLAQVTTAEDAVVQRLREKGLLPPDPTTEPDCKCVCHAPYFSHAVCPHCNGNNEVVRRQREKQRQQLESALATAFVSMQATYNPRERQGYWLECLRLAKEIERLNANGNHNEPTATIPDGKNTAD